MRGKNFRLSEKMKIARNWTKSGLSKQMQQRFLEMDADGWIKTFDAILTMWYIDGNEYRRV